jgi:hypothetical protein
MSCVIGTNAKEMRPSVKSRIVNRPDASTDTRHPTKTSRRATVAEIIADTGVVR